ncbi:MAG: amidohydrolase [Microscillaceae bacterium]|nr:amidohydrolase [Microscillaceae bacterium]
MSSNLKNRTFCPLLQFLYLGMYLGIGISPYEVSGQTSPDKLLPRVELLTTKQAPTLEILYKQLHQNPEISFQEAKTSAKLAEELRKLGYQITQEFGGHGFVGILKNGQGPTVMVRADLDALPVEEKTGLPYASQAKTKDDLGNEVFAMHACGHDIHMSVLMGLARNMADLKSDWKGTLMLIGQPAEERSGGAIAMLKEGLFEKFPVPDYALALHCKADLAAGKVAYCEGYALANVDMVDVYIKGIGGHGAKPHTTIDPIVLGARIVESLQTIVSREISPTDPAVVTVGAFHSGTKHNIIPDDAHLQLTVRAYKDEVRNHIIAAIERMCKYVALSAGVPEDRLPKIEVRPESTPSTYNDPVLTQRLSTLSAKILGKENTLSAEPEMVGEDFARFGRTDEKVPICLFWLGTISPQVIAESQKSGKALPSLHSAYFAPDYQPSIFTGVKVMTMSVLDLLLSKP